MGCAPSTDGNVLSRVVKKAKKESIDSDSELDTALLQKLLKVYPRVDVDIGSGVLSPTDLNQTVIFIFGGKIFPTFIYTSIKLIISLNKVNFMHILVTFKSSEIPNSSAMFDCLLYTQNSWFKRFA